MNKGFSLSVLCLTAGLLLAAAPPSDAQQRQVQEGKRIFDLSCAVCHGDTGGGLEEARLTFPEDHRRCESCHKPGNPDLQAEMPDSFELMRGRVAVGSAFAIGEAPPLKGKGALLAFGDAEALSAYIRASMPRYAPGTLSEAQSRALTALILNWNRAQ